MLLKEYIDILIESRISELLEGTNNVPVDKRKMIVYEATKRLQFELEKYKFKTDFNLYTTIYYHPNNIEKFLSNFINGSEDIAPAGHWSFKYSSSSQKDRKDLIKDLCKIKGKGWKIEITEHDVDTATIFLKLV